MIELYARTLTGPMWYDYDDELIYVGTDRDEAQRVMTAKGWADNEAAIWRESDRNDRLNISSGDSRTKG
jgi:hypothetical protein